VNWKAEGSWVGSRQEFQILLSSAKPAELLLLSQLSSLFPREQRGLEVKVSGGILPLILVPSWCAWGQLSFALQVDLQHFEYKEAVSMFCALSAGHWHPTTSTRSKTETTSAPNLKTTACTSAPIFRIT